MSSANLRPHSGIGTVANEHNPLEIRGGAGDETRTRDIFLGKEVLYQLSYTRS